MPVFQRSIVDEAGNVMPGASVEVRDQVTSGLIQLYSNFALSAAIGNPTTADAEGFVRFYVAAGRYRIVASLGGQSRTWEDEVLGLIDGTGIQYARTAVEISAGVTPSNYQYEAGRVERYGADMTGSSNSSTALQAAVDQWLVGGSPPKAGPGTIRVDSTILAQTSGSTFHKGFYFEGAGMEHTVFDNRVASGALFSITTDTASEFQLGVSLKGFKILTTTSPATSSGIRLRRAYHVRIEDVHIDGMTNDGIEIIITDGDSDACGMVTLRNVRIENCDGWAINSEAASGMNEFSFLLMDQVFVQNNGTASASNPPPSGGVKWKGQILRLQGGAFTLNENAALFVEGGAGLANTLIVDGTAFENNVKKHVWIQGLDSGKFRNIQLYSNDTSVAQKGIYIDGTSSSIRAIDIDGVIVRATSGNNAYTAFEITGSNAEVSKIRCRNVVWQNFDYSGQIRFAGFQFTAIPFEAQLIPVSATSLVLRPYSNSGSVGSGNKVPLRLRGASSTTGEWVEHRLETAGLAISNASLANSTRYYCYLYDNNGVAALSLSTTTPAADSTTGYMVKSDDAGRLYVGSAITDGSAQFVTTGIGWLNPTLVAGPGGTPAYLWAQSSTVMRMSGVAPTSNTDGTALN